MKNVIRAVLTFAAIAIYGLVATMFNTEATLQLGQAAGMQFEDSNAALREYTMLKSFFNGGVLPWAATLILLAVLVGIWWPVLKKLFSSSEGSSKVLMLCLVVLGTAMMPKPAYAYYDTTDKPENVEIAPNETVFWVPASGENKKGQSKFGSLGYYEENKIPAKRFNIPHVLLRQPGLSRDYYIPAGKLYIVNRSPYQREWSRAADKGTSAKNEGFHFESKDSMSVKLDMTVSAFVREDDAAKFLYWFGAVQEGDSNNPEVRYTSVVRAKSLNEVMDTTVRSRVQALLSHEFGKMDLTDCFANKIAVMDRIEAQLKSEFAEKGITIAFLGLASDLSYDKEIQNALNSTFIAKVKSQNKAAYMDALAIEKIEADISVRHAMATAIAKWNGAMPNWLVLPDSWVKVITGWFGEDKSVSTPAKK